MTEWFDAHPRVKRLGVFYLVGSFCLTGSPFGIIIIPILLLRQFL